MIDPFGRSITYLRVSVTDRCDFRCVYCMAEDMTFLPKAEVLSLEELERLCSAFVRRGVKKLRLTGGEPLVRKNVMSLIRGLGRHLDSGALEELTLTTNGSQLAKYAKELAAVGVRRLNVSMDTLDKDKFRELTRWGRGQSKSFWRLDFVQLLQNPITLRPFWLPDDVKAPEPGSNCEAAQEKNPDCPGEEVGLLAPKAAVIIVA